MQECCCGCEFGGDVTTCKCLHAALMTQLSTAHHLHLSHLHYGFWTKQSKATPPPLPHLDGCLTLRPSVYFPVFSSCVLITWQHLLATQPLGLLTSSQRGCRETAGHKTRLCHLWNFSLWPQDTQRFREANSRVTGRPDLSVESPALPLKCWLKKCLILIAWDASNGV
jgi:hypothetical protein